VKTLLGLDRARVWWAESANAKATEDLLLGRFCEATLGLKPFANINGPGLRKSRNLKARTSRLDSAP
jgi:hypothetical protein